MKKKMNRRLALCVAGIFLAGALPLGDMPAGRGASASNVKKGIGQTDHGLQNPRTDQGVTTWDCVYFGNYWQEDTNGDGRADKGDEKTPIKWRVLSVEGDDAFLMADQNLDCQSYNSQCWQVTWEICTMRSWLNGYGAEANKVGMDYSGTGFLNNAFGDSERQAIMATTLANHDNPNYGISGGNDTSDQIYLLSWDELTNPTYGFLSSAGQTDTRQACNTAYTASGGEIQGNMQDAGRVDYWWSRSPGKNSSAAVIVWTDGTLNENYLVNYVQFAVRPVLHLNLAASPRVWRDAGTVTAGKSTATPMPTPTRVPTPTPTRMPASTPTQMPASTPDQMTTPMPNGTTAPTHSPSASPTPATVTTAGPASDVDLETEIREVSADGFVKFVLPKQMAVPANIEKITSILPGEVTVTGQNGKSAVLPVKGGWNYDAAGSCWKNSVDAARLPYGLTDYAGALSDFSIGCEVGDNQGLTFEMTSPGESDSTDGSEGDIIIRRDPASGIDRVLLYRIAKQDEGYVAECKYSTEASEGVTEDSEHHAFIIHTTYSLADAGDYVAVGYGQQAKIAYLSDGIVSLKVTGQKGDGGNGNSSEGNGSVAGGTGNADSKEDDASGEKNQGAHSQTKSPKVREVKKLKVKGKKKGFVLTWKKDGQVSGYQIQVSGKKNFKGAKKIVVKKNKNKSVISGLKSGKKYYVRIRAYKAYKAWDGKAKKKYGKWTVKRGKTKRG